MTTEEKQIAAEKAADYEYHKMYDMGATMEDCVNAGKEAYEYVSGESWSLEESLEFFGIDGEMWEECKDY